MQTCWVMPPSVSSSQAAGSEESAPKSTPLGMDIATSGRSLRRSGSAGQAARQAALLREPALNRCLPFVPFGWDNAA